MKKGERALKNVNDWIEEKKQYYQEVSNKMEKINKWGWIWNLINGSYWCKTPIESGIYCGLTFEELNNLKYYEKIGGKIKWRNVLLYR